jgi:hypothetical protein
MTVRTELEVFIMLDKLWCLIVVLCNISGPPLST